MASDRLVPTRLENDPRLPLRDLPPGFPPFHGLPDAEPRVNWGRYIAALKRFRWLVLAITLVGSGIGVVVARLPERMYEVDATIMISGGTPRGANAGPIRSGELLNNRAWPELVESFLILDKVALQERLYIVPARPADSLLFASFSVAGPAVLGNYRLDVDESGARYTLHTSDGRLVEEGQTGAPIGRQLGFTWTPPASELTPKRSAKFVLRSPRQASMELRDRLLVMLPPNSNFMALRLSGSDPNRIASTMNTVLAEFVAVAAELTKRNVVEIAETLREQLAYAERELRDAEIALENFRVNTITLPSEGSAVAGGVELTRDPVLSSFFRQKVDLDDVQRNREVLEGMLTEIRRGGVDVSVFLAAPAIRDADGLRAALAEYATRTGELRTLRLAYTDEHRPVRDLITAVEAIRNRIVSQEVPALIGQLQRRENDLQSRLGAASRELRDIPTRTIEEMRLRRNVDVSDNLYTMLKNRYEEARLADVSSTPDISVLNQAVAPSAPGPTTFLPILLMAFAGSFGAGVVLAVVLDRIDSRFRYPEQATRELGLNVIGAVPTIARTSGARAKTDQGVQIVEAFRGIRLNLQHACADSSAAPVAVTVTSPGADDGKSLVCANLALAFAEAGYRTLLIDGDIRRGELHAAFSITRQPGLVDYLAGEAVLTDILRQSTHERLTLITSGSRRRSGPELLTSRALPALMRIVRPQFDAIVVDSAPLGAGVDAFVLGTVTANMLVVLRSGGTDRHLAEAKLELVDRLPIRLVGAVLNDVPPSGPYQYYSYLPGYGSEEEERLAPAGRGV